MKADKHNQTNQKPQSFCFEGHSLCLSASANIAVTAGLLFGDKIMRHIEVTITDDNGKVILRATYHRHNRQGKNPEGFRYFDPKGWVISIVPPTQDHEETYT